MSLLLSQVLKANLYIQPILFTVIMITNTLVIRVLCSRVLRISPCTYYLIIYTIFTSIYICISCPTQTLRGIFIGWENTLIGCNIYFFVYFTPSYIAQAMLVLASFDRYCSSSKSHRLNSRSTKRTAYISIIITTITATIYMSPMSFIYYFDGTTNTCRQYTSLPVNIFVFSQIITYFILAPLLMILLGILTIKNIHRYSILRIAPQNSERHNRRTEGQLTRMLLLQVLSHLILTSPFGVVYFMNSFIPSTRTPDIIAIRFICSIGVQLNYLLSFFLYILSGSVYREQLCRLFKFTRRQNHLNNTILNPQTEANHQYRFTKNNN